VRKFACADPTHHLILRQADLPFAEPASTGFLLLRAANTELPDISYEMPPKILNFLQKNQESLKITEKQGFLEEKTFGLARRNKGLARRNKGLARRNKGLALRNKGLARRNKGLAGQTRHLERETLHPARQTGHRARPIKGSARQTTRRPRQSLLQRTQLGLGGPSYWGGWGCLGA
jgi:hypothetical protein